MLGAFSCGSDGRPVAAAELAPKLLRGDSTAPFRECLRPAGAFEAVAGGPRAFADHMTLSRSGPLFLLLLLFLLFVFNDSGAGLLRRTPRMPSSEGSTSCE
jgi:hypothetical protein